MDKVEQKFKKYILANKILATIFAAICVCSIAVFAICVANCPNWLVYVLVFLLCAILPICVFLSICGIDLGYFKNTKLELFEDMKDLYMSMFDIDVTRFEDFDDWKDFYQQIDFEKLKCDAINQAKKDFCDSRFYKFEDLKKYNNHVKIFQKLVKVQLVDNIVEKYNNDLKSVLEKLYPKAIKDAFYPQEYEIVEKIVLSFLKGKNFLSKESIWGFKGYGTYDNYPDKPTKIDFEFFRERYLNKTIFYNSKETKAYIPTKIEVDDLEKEKDYCIKSTQATFATKQRTQNLVYIYNLHLENFWLTDARKASLCLPNDLASKVEEKPQNTSHFSKNSFRYVNHCWNCGTPIDEDWYKSSAKCSKCGFFKCRKCGKCFCDDKN